MLSPEYRTLLRKADLSRRARASVPISRVERRSVSRGQGSVMRGLAPGSRDGDSSILRALAIYLQGSTALGTTVKPIGRQRT